jgi:hypothetical protein
MTGRELGADELVPRLVREADRRRDLDRPLRPSEVILVVRADRRLPWEAVRRLIEACAHPDVRIGNVAFAVRPEPESARW